MSDTYGPLERSIAHILVGTPRIKSAAKAVYSRLSYLKSRKKFRCYAAGELHPIGVGQGESFFGYYDKSPVSSNGYSLCHLAHCGTREKPVPDSPVFLALFGPDGDKPLWQSPVSAFNWQQGTRAHWIDGDHFIFNDFDKESEKYISRVFTSSTLQEAKRFDLPVQDSFGTDYFLSLNCRRLAALCPDYGYRNLPPLSNTGLADTTGDGIWKVAFDSGESVLLISLADICAVNSQPEFTRAFHAVNHILVSPSGGKFVFIHRYYSGGRRFDRLMLADAQCGQPKLFADYDMVSHFCWLNDSLILGYLRGPDGKDGYWVLDIETGRFNRFADGALDGFGDGHPYVCGDWFITDTYPDKARMQHLILANWKSGEVRELGLFFHGFAFDAETRCDLHPRFSPDGKSVFFDSVFSGKRSLYRMDLDG